MVNILFVDDDIAITDSFSAYLKSESFYVTVVNDGVSVIEMFKKKEFDLIILDIMLPGKTGIEICKEIRDISDIPIIMLTAKTEEIDKIVGLEIGADDYVSKPFSPRELIARIKALLRRASKFNEEKSIYVFGDIEMNLKQYSVKKNRRTLSLTKSEFAILHKLIENPDQVVTREKLMKVITGFDKYIFDRTIDTHIKNLRKKIEDNPKKPVIIKTVRGVGYRLNKKI